MRPMSPGALEPGPQKAGRHHGSGSEEGGSVRFPRCQLTDAHVDRRAERNSGGEGAMTALLNPAA